MLEKFLVNLYLYALSSNFLKCEYKIFIFYLFFLIFIV